MWDLSCADWEDRIRARGSLIPDLPLIRSEADLAVRIFDELQLPDVPGTPRMAEAAGPWFREIVAAAFGSWDPVAHERLIKDIFLLAPKGQSKTSYSAALMVTALIMNKRPKAEALFVAPTQAISDRAYEQAVGMIKLNEATRKRFTNRDHLKTIEDLHNGSTMKVKTFDLNILTGAAPFLVLLDELHLLGKNQHTTKVLRQIRGGLEKRPEGLLLITTTQSDDPPAGAFRDELINARKVRDGALGTDIGRPMLPVLYEFPPAIARDQEQWQDTANWSMVMPNLGRSVRLNSLAADWESERAKGDHAVRIWASQHLNIEIGLGLRTDAWVGATLWERCIDPAITLEAMLGRCDVITASIDGGGMDDLLGLALLGRERGTGNWLAWFKAWAHAAVLERRKSEASRLRDFEADGDLVVVDEPGTHVVQAVDVVEQVFVAGLLGGVGLDSYDIKDIVNELAARGITGETTFGDQRADLVQGIPQGWKISGAIKKTELMLASRHLIHAGRPMMAWCLSNAKVEPKGNAISITKAAAGVAKIDPLVALFNAVELMTRDPKPGFISVYERRGIVLI